MPDSARLRILTDLREKNGLTLEQMAQWCGLHGGQSRKTVGEWEAGEAIPRQRRAPQFLTYLLDGLHLRTDPPKCQALWDLLVDEWGWEPLPAAAWGQEFNPAPQTATPTSLEAIVWSEPALPPVLDRFVGCAVDLAYYQQALTTEGVAAITGMVGVGKSSLAAQLAQNQQKPRHTFWQTLYPGEGVSAILWRIAAFLAAWHNQPALWRLLTQQSQTQVQPPTAVILDYLFTLLKGHDFLLCFDDFHRLADDPARAGFTSRLHRAVQAGDFQLIVTSQEVIDFGGASGYRLFTGLSFDDARQLVQVESFRGDDSLLAALCQKTEGNGALLTLGLQALQSSAEPAMLLQQLAYTRPIEQRLLTTVDAHLTPEERQVMQGVALLLGQPATPIAIEETLGGQPVQRVLTHLCNRNLLRQALTAQGKVYVQSQIVQQFYYEFLDQRTRRAMHQRAAAYYQHQVGDFFYAARHYWAAAEAEQAATLLVQDIRGQLAHGRAAALCELLEKVIQAPLPRLLQAEVAVAQGQVYTFLQQNQRAQRSLTQAHSCLVAEGEEPGARHTRSQACRELGYLLIGVAPEEALRWLQRGVSELTAEETTQRADFAILLGQANTRLGQMPAAEAAYTQALQLLPPQAGWSQLLALIGLGKHHFHQNNTEQSRHYLLRAQAMADELHDLLNGLAARANLAALYQITGEWDLAFTTYAQATTLAEQLGYRRESARIDLNSGVLYSQSGDTLQAHVRLTRALANAQSHAMHELAVIAQGYLAVLALSTGEAAQAYSYLEAAETLCQQKLFTFLQPFLSYVRAAYFLAVSDHAQARIWAEGAIASAQAQGMRQEEGLGWRLLGESYSAGDQLEQASAAFRTSLALLTANRYEAALTQKAWGNSLYHHQQEEAGHHLLENACTTLQSLGAQRAAQEITEQLASRFNSSFS